MLCTSVGIMSVVRASPLMMRLLLPVCSGLAVALANDVLHHAVRLDATTRSMLQPSNAMLSTPEHVALRTNSLSGV